MNPASLPESQLEALEHVQNALVSDARRAATEISKSLGVRVRDMTARLKAARWNKTLVEAQIKELMAEFGADLTKHVFGLIRDAAGYVERYQRRLIRYRVEQKEPLKPSEIKWASEGRGKGPARSAAAYARAAGKEGNPFLKSGRLALSNKIHKMTRYEAEEVTRRVIRSIREAQSLEFASRELVDVARHGLGKGESLPKLIKQVQEKAKNLEITIGPDEFQEEMGAIKAYLRRLKGGIPDMEYAKKIGVPLKRGVPFVRAGRMQGAYMELVKDLADGRAAEKAVKKWVYQKQRYRAEMICHSEATSAFRLRQAQRGEQRPWIIGYTVKLNRGGHTRWVASKPGKQKSLGTNAKGKGIYRCACEFYNGLTISVRDYVDQFYRGFHPW